MTQKTRQSSLLSSKARVVAVNMGYGHQRTAYPLRFLAPDQEVINANSYQGIPQKDRKIWETIRHFYEFVSSSKKVPLIGELAFGIFNKFQDIASLYPKRDLSQPNFSVKWIYFLIKRGWGRHLIGKLGKNPLPLITTFFVPAFMAEFFNYPGEILCVVCDADISRAWAAMNPRLSRIKYFAPTARVVERLKLYGVKPENIFLTGYPLPLENLGGERLEILRHDLAHRLLNLDPQEKYSRYYWPLIKKYLGGLPKKSNHKLTLMFAVGGAGAHRDIGLKALKSLAWQIKEEKIRVILVAGLREKLRNYFIRHIRWLGLQDYLDKDILLIFERDISRYFQGFNQALRTTDILWTKPSELSFYTALGLPMIIAPPIGSHEELNREWLINLGSGIVQKNPNYVREWLFDLLASGWFAQAALQGFIEGEKLGIFNIQKIVAPLCKRP